MRKVARVTVSDVDARWIILHETDKGVYVFPCATEYDGSATGDMWYETLSEADAACAQAYGVSEDAWKAIGDPLPGCQQDWVSPVRILGRKTASPLRGEFERLVDGAWVPVDSTNPAPTIEAAIRQADETGDSSDSH